MFEVRVLGCGPSGGVPHLDSGWGACDPENPRNLRLRSSLLISSSTTRLLIDTSPDCRQQLLRAGVSRLDAILYTHAHADHCHGLNDLRGIHEAMGTSLPVYGTEETLNALVVQFPYAFRRVDKRQPMLLPHTLHPNHTLHLGDLSVVPFLQDHGFSQSLGFRIGGLVYSTDVVACPENLLTQEAPHIWVVDTYQTDPHPTHSHLDQTLSWIHKVRPERAYLTHMNNTLDYARLCARLPSWIQPAYDGLTFCLP